MVQSVLVPGHIKGYLVLLSQDVASEVMFEVDSIRLADDSVPYFLLWNGGCWRHNPSDIEVRIRQTYGGDEYHLCYGRMRSRDEYNRAHLLVAGHSPATGDVKRGFNQMTSELLDDLVTAVRNLNDYQERESAEKRTIHPLLRAWKWLGSSPNEDRMMLPWSVLVAVVANVDLPNTVQNVM